eukprot:CAMPEP_0176127310 /NCGR_PEP_ID=MMETSP0120_2-20121206/64293_1 /TAXON_ID=160619 /ORGANISM="Kryptoperidinium foliaceum, Strain CCMP 1326" /LENGTH=336 /DNA_ID=CAMNT_0017462319 /DNA_START=66 /DNA_END=1075 /DNA_ORIENTATION=-
MARPITTASSLLPHPHDLAKALLQTHGLPARPCLSGLTSTPAGYKWPSASAPGVGDPKPSQRRLHAEASANVREAGLQLNRKFLRAELGALKVCAQRRLKQRLQAMLLHEACCYLLTSVHRPDLHRLRRAVAEVQPHLHEQGGQLHREVRARGRARLRWRPARRRTALIGREDAGWATTPGGHVWTDALRCVALPRLRLRPLLLRGLGLRAWAPTAWACMLWRAAPGPARNKSMSGGLIVTDAESIRCTRRHGPAFSACCLLAMVLRCSGATSGGGQPNSSIKGWRSKNAGEGCKPEHRRRTPRSAGLACHRAGKVNIAASEAIASARLHTAGGVC